VTDAWLLLASSLALEAALTALGGGLAEELPLPEAHILLTPILGLVLAGALPVATVLPLKVAAWRLCRTLTALER
jgi:hypothetical protein